MNNKRTKNLSYFVCLWLLGDEYLLAYPQATEIKGRGHEKPTTHFGDDILTPQGRSIGCCNYLWRCYWTPHTHIYGCPVVPLQREKAKNVRMKKPIPSSLSLDGNNSSARVEGYLDNAYPDLRQQCYLSLFCTFHWGCDFLGSLEKFRLCPISIWCNRRKRRQKGDWWGREAIRWKWG